MSQSYVVEPAHPGGGRAHARFRVTIPVDCSTQHLFISNHVSNISKGGLLIRSHEPLPLNAEVALALRLPETAGNQSAPGPTGRSQPPVDVPSPAGAPALPILSAWDVVEQYRQFRKALQAIRSQLPAEGTPGTTPAPDLPTGPS